MILQLYRFWERKKGKKEGKSFLWPFGCEEAKKKKEELDNYKTTDHKIGGFTY